LLVLVSTVAEAAEPMQRDGTRERVARLALVEFGGDERT